MKFCKVKIKFPWKDEINESGYNFNSRWTCKRSWQSSDWSSSLGSAFGVAISAAVYGAIAANGNLETAATVGIFVNVIFGVLSIFSTTFLVPKDAGKTSNAPKKLPVWSPVVE